MVQLAANIVSPWRIIALIETKTGNEVFKDFEPISSKKSDFPWNGFERHGEAFKGFGPISSKRSQTPKSKNRPAVPGRAFQLWPRADFDSETA